MGLCSVLEDTANKLPFTQLSKQAQIKINDLHFSTVRSYYCLHSRWDGQRAFDRSRGNRRNWIRVWEDGYCNFAASSSTYNDIGNCEFQGLQPELFFKMSHVIYNYGKGLIGKVAADHSYKWIYKEPNDQEINLLSSCLNSADTHPRTWEAQFQSGIKTIALIAVREGVVQLGATHKVIEDLSSVVSLRKKFNCIKSIPRVLFPNPSSYSSKVDGFGSSDTWQFPGVAKANPRITPSMSSLEALLSKLPSVVPQSSPSQFLPRPQTPLQLISMEKVVKAEIHQPHHHDRNVGETSNSISLYNCYQNEHS